MEAIYHLLFEITFHPALNLLVKENNSSGAKDKSRKVLKIEN